MSENFWNHKIPEENMKSDDDALLRELREWARRLLHWERSLKGQKRRGKSRVHDWILKKRTTERRIPTLKGRLVQGRMKRNTRQSLAWAFFIVWVWSLLTMIWATCLISGLLTGVDQKGRNPGLPPAAIKSTFFPNREWKIRLPQLWGGR